MHIYACVYMYIFSTQLVETCCLLGHQFILNRYIKKNQRKKIQQVIYGEKA